MTCKDCICFDACLDMSPYPSKVDIFLECDFAKDCKHFKDKSRMIELPCKIGDTVYVIKRCRCGKPNNYQIRQCHKKSVPNTPKFLARIMIQEMGRRIKPEYFGKLEWEDVPKGTICYSVYEKQFTLKMVSEIGKTVFTTKEEAEKALKECKGQ